VGEGVHGRRERLPNDSTEGFSVELYSLFGLLKSVARERREKFSVVRTGGYFERFGRHSFGRRRDRAPFGSSLEPFEFKNDCTVDIRCGCLHINFLRLYCGRLLSDPKTIPDVVPPNCKRTTPTKTSPREAGPTPP